MWSNPKPTITEKDVLDQKGRVFLITGGYAGCGLELAKSLYQLNGTVYIAGRSAAKASAAIDSIKASAPQSSEETSGQLHFLNLDLADLRIVKASAETFLQREKRLDIVWHNAGVMVPPDGSKTAQGLDLQLGTNAIGPFLLQRFLTPRMLETASAAAPGATRVIWLSSNAHAAAPSPDGVNWDDLDMHAQTGFPARFKRYGQSKAMNIMYAHEMARRYGPQGLVSLSVHPGSLRTTLQRDLPWAINALFDLRRSEPRFGGLVELFGGFASDVSTTMVEDGGRNGGYIVPWGKFEECAKYISSGLKKRKTGERLWDVSEEMVKEYL
ncbi:NAD(P)-binding protein [Glonium stellatum]|uniref:NAD(P)-binding protein n=1 Tax=Glonium stellatum TaxID=574774 RepID=A0A8E2JUZ0_9PEZI|nr:NAD(P)-binding protein [Glonium stellatum]